MSLYVLYFKLRVFLLYGTVGVERHREIQRTSHLATVKEHSASCIHSGEDGLSPKCLKASRCSYVAPHGGPSPPHVTMQPCRPGSDTQPHFSFHGDGSGSYGKTLSAKFTCGSCHVGLFDYAA